VTIQDLGSLGEFIAAIATVATLGYLAVQIRQNTNSVKGAGAASYRDGLNSFVSLLAQDGALADLYYDGLDDPEALNETERRQFESVLGMFVTYLQQAEELETAGSLSYELAHTRDAQIEFLVSKPGFRASYDSNSHYYPPKFHGRIRDAILSQSNLSSGEITPAAAQQSAAADSA
jgi:hypothetical protein